MKTQSKQPAKNPQDLAAVFNRIEAAANAVEDVSKAILATIKAAKAHTLDQFNQMVSDAYQANGWSQKAGRPGATDKLKPAPGAVKLYVSTIRAAYRYGLRVMSYDLMEAIRIDLRAARKIERDRAQPTQQEPEMAGVQVQQENALTGALWHDALVVREHLDEEQKALFDAQVRRLLAKYRKEAPAELLKAS